MECTAVFIKDGRVSKENVLRKSSEEGVSVRVGESIALQGCLGNIAAALSLDLSKDYTLGAWHSHQLLWLNVNLSLETQGLAGTEFTLIVVGLRGLAKRGTASQEAQSRRSSVRGATMRSATSAAPGPKKDLLEAWFLVDGKRRWCSLQEHLLFVAKNERSPLDVICLDCYDVRNVTANSFALSPHAGAGFAISKERASHTFEAVAPGSGARAWTRRFRVMTPDSLRCVHFGVDLALFAARGASLPLILMDCMRELIARGLQVPELFRQEGDADSARFFRDTYDEGKQPDLSSADPHTVAGLLRSWLRELPQPIVTFSLYSEFATCMKVSDRVPVLQRSIAKLPAINQRILWALTHFLKLVNDNNGVNFMAASNLAPIFAMSIMSPEKTAAITFNTTATTTALTEYLILQCALLFDPAMHSCPPTWTEICDVNRKGTIAARTPVVSVPEAENFGTPPPPPRSATLHGVAPSTPPAGIPPPRSATLRAIPASARAAAPPPRSATLRAVPVSAHHATMPAPAPPPAAPHTLPAASLPPPPNTSSLPPPPAASSALPPPPASSVSLPPPPPAAAPETMESLRAENAALKRRVAQLEQQVAQLTHGARQ